MWKEEGRERGQQRIGEMKRTTRKHRIIRAFLRFHQPPPLLLPYQRELFKYHHASSLTTPRISIIDHYYQKGLFFYSKPTNIIVYYLKQIEIAVATMAVGISWKLIQRIAVPHKIQLFSHIMNAREHAHILRDYTKENLVLKMCEKFCICVILLQD